MENINKLKQQIQSFIDKTEDKDIIASLSEISVTIDNIEADTTALESDNRELLRDYKDLIKHTSFSTEKAPERGVPEAPNFDDFLTKAIAETKK